MEGSSPSYHILKSVQGTFNQGNVVFFGESAGRQCACTVMHCFHCVGQLLERFPYGSILT